MTISTFVRRNTAAEWTAANPVLDEGEPGYEKHTGQVKYGDGITPWNLLPYEAVGPQGLGVGTGPAGPEGEPGPPGPPGVADDASVAALLTAPASLTRLQMDANYVRAVVVAGPGIDPTGAVNSSTAIQAKLDAAAAVGGTVIFVPGATYLCAGLTAGDNLTIMGHGATLQVPATGGTILSLLDAGNATVTGLTFRGTLADLAALDLSAAGGTAEIGILLNKTHGTRIDGCKFYNLNTAGIRAASTGNTTTGGRFDGDSNRITGIHAENCFYGLDFDTRGEYTTTTGAVVQRNRFGIRIKGGNTLLTGCHVNGNALGLHVASDTNSGHGSAVGCAFNHNTTTAIQVDETLNGFVFTGCQFFASKVFFNGCSGVIITGSEIGAPVQLKGGGWNTIKDTVAVGSPVVTHNFEGAADSTIVAITKIDGTVLT